MRGNTNMDLLEEKTYDPYVIITGTIHLQHNSLYKKIALNFMLNSMKLRAIFLLREFFASPIMTVFFKYVQLMLVTC